jgi:uncharacterized membrane protein YebE (DUF533 family)
MLLYKLVMPNPDPSDTLIRLVRSTAYATSPGHAEKIRALAAVSSVGAAAYAQTRKQAERVTGRAGRGEVRKPKPLSEDNEAAIFRFHAADATLMIRAMVGAAAADGEIDGREKQRLLGYLRDSGANPAEIRFAQAQAGHAATVEELASAVTSRETAVEVYAAALLVADGGSFTTRQYLGRLAAALKLDKEFVANLHAQWGDREPFVY